MQNDLKEPLLRENTNCLEPTMEEVMSELDEWNPYRHDIFTGHEGAVWSTLSTSNNEYLFSGSEDRSIIIWHAVTGTIYGKLLGHENTVNALELTENEEKLISGAWDNSIRIWDWKNKTLVGNLVGHTAGVYCFAMSKDRKILLSGAGDYKVRMWDIESIAEVGTLDCSNSSVFGLALGKEGKHILAGGWDANLRIWNFETKSLVSQTAVNAGVIQSLAVTADSKYIIIGTRNNIVKIWNYDDKSDLFIFDVHNNWVRNLVTTSDSGYFITCSADKTMRIVNLKEKVEEFNLEGHEGYVFGLSLSKDGKFLLSGASDKTLRRWEIGKASRATLLKGHLKCIMSVTTTSDNRYIVSGSEDRTIRIWSIEEKKEVACLTGHTDTVWGVAVTSNMEYIVSVSGDKFVKIWNYESRQEIASLSGHENPIFCVTVSHDSQYAVSGAQDKLVMVWDLQTREKGKRLEGHTDTVFTVKVSNDSKYIISGAADYTIRIWKFETFSLFHKIETKSGMIESISINYNDSLLVLGDRSNSVHLWNWKEKGPLTKFTVHTKWVKSVCFAGDGNLFASCSNDWTIRVWNAKERRQEFMLLGHGNTIRSVCFTPDQQKLISGSEDLTVRIWDLQNMRNLELGDFLGPIDSFLLMSKIKLNRPPRLSIANIVFSSLRVNLAHVYSFLGNDEFLEKTLELGTYICVDTRGKSPLHYALSRNSQGCVDVILSFLVELKHSNADRFFNFTNAIRDDFVDLLQNSSPFLPNFLETLFCGLESQNLPKFGVPTKSLPIYHLTESEKLDKSYFLHDNKALYLEQPVVFKSLPIQVCMNIGAFESISLLHSILMCTNPKVFRTHIVQTLINIKWSQVFQPILFFSSLLWVSIILMITQMVLEEVSPLLLFSFLALNLIILIYEFAKAYFIGILVYLDFWNSVSILRFLLCSMWCILLYNGYNSYYIGWFMALFNFMQGFYNLKVFSCTRLYSRLVFTAIFDAFPFILIFIYSTLSVGFLHYIANKDSSMNLFYMIWQSPYQLNMDELGTEAMPLDYVYFVIASLLNVVVMLNLLIAVLGDSFDRHKNESVEIQSAEMLESILEMEYLMFWNRGNNTKVFIHVSQDPRLDSYENNWEGKIKAVTNSVKQAQEENRKHFAQIKDYLKDMELVKKSLKVIEARIEKIPIK